MEGVDFLKGFLFPYINFIIFFFLAYKLFKKPILNMINSRKQNFEALANEAARAKAEAIEKQKELDSRLASLDNEIKGIRERAMHSAQAEADSLIEKAKSLSTHMVEESKRLADARVKQAQEELRAEIVKEVASQVSERLRNDVNPDLHKSLISGRIKTMAALEQEA